MSRRSNARTDDALEERTNQGKRHEAEQHSVTCVKPNGRRQFGKAADHDGGERETLRTGCKSVSRNWLGASAMKSAQRTAPSGAAPVRSSIKRKPIGL
jgi:hypothetical protein